MIDSLQSRPKVHRKSHGLCAWQLATRAAAGWLLVDRLAGAAAQDAAVPLHGRTLRATLDRIPTLPPDRENAYAGQPAPVVPTRTLVRLASATNATFWGPTDEPLPQHVCTWIFSIESNSYFDAMLANLARSHRSRLLSMADVPDDAGPAGRRRLQLYIKQQPVVVYVDDQFYRESAEPGAVYDGLGYGLNLGTRAWWPAAWNKAFAKLVDAYRSDFLSAAVRANQPGFFDFSRRGFSALPLVLPTAAMEALVPSRVVSRSLRQTPDATLAAALEQIGQGDAVGVFALEQASQFNRSSAWSPDPTNAQNYLSFDSGNLCQIYDYFSYLRLDCLTADDQPFTMQTGYAYMVYGGEAAPPRMQLRDSNHASAPFTDDDLFYNASGNKPFAVSYSMLRDLNGTLYTAALPKDAVPVAAEAPPNPVGADLLGTPWPAPAPAPQAQHGGARRRRALSAWPYVWAGGSAAWAWRAAAQR